jgi:hypothetical protein
MSLFRIVGHDVERLLRNAGRSPQQGTAAFIPDM